MKIEKILEVHANHVKAIANNVTGIVQFPVDTVDAKSVDFVYNAIDKSWVCITNNQLIPKNEPLFSALNSIILGASKLWSTDIKS